MGGVQVRCCQQAYQFYLKEKIDMDIQVLSAAFHQGETIPVQYTCDGNNVSPPLRWGSIPKDAQSLALQEGATKHELARAIEGHILATGHLMGTYKRRAS
jgi:phosphatidylethanolamine-binding protein (PEBP) family uncharacterized protein